MINYMELSPDQLPEFKNLVCEIKGSSSNPANDAYQILHPTKEITLIAARNKPLKAQVFDLDMTIEPGEVLFLNKDVLYLIENQSDSSYYEITLPKRIISFWDNSYMQKNEVDPILEDKRIVWFLITPDTEDDRQVIHKIEELVDLYYSSSSYNLLYRLSVYTVMIFADILKIFPDLSDTLDNKMIPRILKVINYIEEHYSEPVTQTQLADIAGVRIAVLDHAFQEFVRCSPVKYLIRYRLYISTHLLKNTKDKVQEISHAVGFNAPSSYILQFKKEFGRTPKEYRAVYHKPRVLLTK